MKTVFAGRPATLVVVTCSVLVAGILGCSSDSGGPKDKDAGDGGGLDGGGDLSAADTQADVSGDVPADVLTDTQPGDVASDGIRDGGDDVKDTGINLDVAPPPMLTATVTNRRDTTIELLWPAPSNAG